MSATLSPPSSPWVAGSTPLDVMARKSDLCRRDLSTFVELAWPITVPKPFIPGRYVSAICEHLQAISEGTLKKLVINVGPGYAKSTLSCVLWPSWQWITRPSTQSIFGSYDIHLALRDADRSREIILSEWYQEFFNPSWKLSKSTNAKGYYMNTVRGHRYSFGMKARGRGGWRGDQVIVDDPISVDDQFDPKVKEDTRHRWNNTLSTRVNDPATASFILVGHRVASDDLFATAIKDPTYTVLKLTSVFDPGERVNTSIGWVDWRQNKGDLLCAELFPQVELDYLREIKLGEQGFTTQHLQNPSIESGNWFDKNNFRYYEADKSGILKLYCKGGQEKLVDPRSCWSFVSMDVAASLKTMADYTCFGVWLVTKQYDMILINLIMKRMTAPQTLDQACELFSSSKQGGRKPHVAFLVERNGMGITIAQNLQESGLPVIDVHVSDNKVTEAATATIRLSYGSIFFPYWESGGMDKVYGYMKGFEEELINFPGVDHDDRTSMLSIAANGLYETGIGGLGGAISVKNAFMEQQGQNPTKNLKDIVETTGNGFATENKRRSMYGEKAS